MVCVGSNPSEQVLASAPGRDLGMPCPGLGGGWARQTRVLGTGQSPWETQLRGPRPEARTHCGPEEGQACPGTASSLPFSRKAKHGISMGKRVWLDTGRSGWILEICSASGRKWTGWGASKRTSFCLLGFKNLRATCLDPSRLLSKSRCRRHRIRT